MPSKEQLDQMRRLREAMIAGESFTSVEATERFGVGKSSLNAAILMLKREGHTLTREREGQYMRYRCTDCTPVGDGATDDTAASRNGGTFSPGATLVVFPYPIIGDKLEVDFIQRGKAKGTVDIGLKAPDGSVWLVQVVGRTT